MKALKLNFNKVKDKKCNYFKTQNLLLKILNRKIKHFFIRLLKSKRKLKFMKNYQKKLFIMQKLKQKLSKKVSVQVNKKMIPV